MYDITSENITYDAMYTYPYFGAPIFSFKFDLSESNYSGNLIYYLAYSHNNKEEEYGDTMSVKKISFSSMTFDKKDVASGSETQSKLNDRSVTSFVVDDVNDDNFRIFVAIYTSSGGRYNFNIYSLSDLTKKCSKELYDHVLTTDKKGKDGKGHGLYFKMIYLGNRHVVNIYFISNADDQHPRFQSLYIEKEGDTCFKFTCLIYKEISENLKTDLLYNDFIKITDTRLAFISTKGESKLFILLMDLYNDYKNVQMRTYEYDISSYKINKELAAHVYNGYLGFSSTVNNNGIFSIFMLFGFGNGTDFTIDISPHLMDTGEYVDGNDLVTRLLNNLTIDNNIFGYIPIEQIILVSYPEELLFYSKDDQEKLIPFGSIIDNTIILKQNLLINKTHQLY